jgi:hypothetical protein
MSNLTLESLKKRVINQPQVAVSTLKELNLFYFIQNNINNSQDEVISLFLNNFKQILVKQSKGELELSL